MAVTLINVFEVPAGRDEEVRRRLATHGGLHAGAAGVPVRPAST